MPNTVIKTAAPRAKSILHLEKMSIPMYIQIKIVKAIYVMTAPSIGDLTAVFDLTEYLPDDHCGKGNDKIDAGQASDYTHDNKKNNSNNLTHNNKSSECVF